MKTSLLAIQLSNSGRGNQVIAEYEALLNRLSVIDFSQCEQFLKDNALVPLYDTISYSKTDWNPALTVFPQKNNTANSTKSSVVTYELFAKNGTKIDRNLCKSSLTRIYIPIKNFKKINYSDTGYDPYNVNSEYFNDICKPILTNETVATIREKRSNFKGLNASCHGGCLYDKINKTTGYLSCLCNTSSQDNEASPTFSNIFIQFINQSNIHIFKCYNLLPTVISIILMF